MAHRRIALALIPSVLSIAATAVAAQQPDSSHQALSFTFPRTVGAFRLIGSERLQEAGAGTQLRYAREQDRDWIDVYVYPTPQDSSCGGACDSVALNREVDDFAGMIPELLRRGYYDSLRVAGDSRITLGTGAAARRGRHLLLIGGREGHAVTSHYYLVGDGPVLVKVRATFPPEMRMDSAIDAFANGFMNGAGAPPIACAGGPAHSRGLTMTSHVAAPMAQLSPQVDAALRRLGYTFDQPAPGQWITTPITTLPDRKIWESMKGRIFPGLVLEIHAEAKGNGSTLAVTGTPVCGVSEQAEDAAVLAGVMELVTGIPGAH